MLHLLHELAVSNTHAELQAELDRRGRRPNVTDTFRDDIELDQSRLTFSDVEPFSGWKKLAEGGFGVVYYVEDASPPVQLHIQVKGGSHVKHFRDMAVKVPKPEGVAELKAEVEALSKLAHENIVAILGMTQGPHPTAMCTTG